MTDEERRTLAHAKVKGIVGATIVMAVSAAALVLMTVAASAQDFASPSRMTLIDGAGGCIARIRVENRAGMYNATETLQTPRGPVSIRYVTVGGHRPGDDDRIEVTALPDGLGARPMEAGIVDGQTLDVCLFEWVLG